MGRLPGERGEHEGAGRMTHLDERAYSHPPEAGPTEEPGLSSLRSDAVLGGGCGSN